MSEPAIKDEILEEEEAEQKETEPRPEFIVDSDRKADWCLRQIKEKQDEIDRWTEHYKQLAQAITDQLNDDIAFFSAQLERYLMRQIDNKFTKATKTQISYQLPAGKLILKHQEPEYKPNDEILVPWLEQNNPEFVKVKKTADWSGLKKTLTLNGDTLITDDGEIVPGITVTPREDKFMVDTKKKEGK